MPTDTPNSRTESVLLRDVVESDFPVFYKNERDPVARHMAAFTQKDPADRTAFGAHWSRIRGDRTIMIKTILFDGQVAGSVLSFDLFGAPTVSYWIRREFWGKGIATEAFAKFLQLNTTRPIYARVAKDNIASIRVLEKCGFAMSGVDKGFANARGAEIEELIFELKAKDHGRLIPQEGC